jgi:HEAT repeat protein
MRMLCFCILISIVVAVQSQATPELQTLLVQLKAPETTHQSASKLMSISQSQPAVRNLLSDELPTMLVDNDDFDVMQAETMLAGDLKLETTIHSLVNLLNKPVHSFHSRKSRYILEDRTLTRFAELRDDPVARALSEIGEPALPALSVPLESPSVDVRRRAIRILLRIKTPQSRAMLQQRVSKETDVELKKYLAANDIRIPN